MDSIEDDEVSPPRTAAQAGEQRPQQPGAVPVLRQRHQGQLVLTDAAPSPRGQEVSSGSDESAGQHAPRKPGILPAQRRRPPGHPPLAAAPHAQRKPQPISSCDTSAEDVSTSDSESDGQCCLPMSQPAARKSSKEVASMVLAGPRQLSGVSLPNVVVLYAQAPVAEEADGSRLVLDLRPETLATLQPSALFKCACELGHLNIVLGWHTATLRFVLYCLPLLLKKLACIRRPPGRLLFKPVHDCNSLLLPPMKAAAAPAAPSAAALCPLPDMAAVIASGLRRGLVAPVDLVELRDRMRASAAEDMHTRAFPCRLHCPRACSSYNLFTTMTWLVAAGYEQAAGVCNLGTSDEEKNSIVPPGLYQPGDPCNRHHVRSHVPDL